MYAASLLLWGLGDGLLAPLFPLYLDDLGASPAENGLVFGFGNAVAAFAVLPAGYLADRIGLKPVLVSGWFVALAGALVLIVMRDWQGGLLASALIYGGIIATPATSAYVVAVSEAGALSGTIGIAYGARFLGTIVGAPFAGALAASLGYRETFAIALVFFAVSTAVILTIRPLAPQHEREAFRPPRAFWVLLAVVPLAAVLTIVSRQLLPLFLVEVAGIPLERIGVYALLLALGSSLFVALNGRLADRSGLRVAMLAGAAVLTVAAGMFLVPERGELLIGLATFLLGATAAASPVLFTAVAWSMPRTRASIGFAIYLLASTIGLAFGGALAGFLYAADPYLPFTFTLVLALPVAALVAASVVRPLRDFGNR